MRSERIKEARGGVAGEGSGTGPRAEEGKGMTDSVLIREARRAAGSEVQIGVLWNWIESLSDALEDVVAHGLAMLSPEMCERHGMGAKGVNCGFCQGDFENALTSIDGYVP